MLAASAVGHTRPRGRAPNGADGRPKVWDGASGEWKEAARPAHTAAATTSAATASAAAAANAVATATAGTAGSYSAASGVGVYHGQLYRPPDTDGDDDDDDVDDDDADGGGRTNDGTDREQLGARVAVGGAGAGGADESDGSGSETEDEYDRRPRRSSEVCPPSRTAVTAPVGAAGPPRQPTPTPYVVHPAVC